MRIRYLLFTIPLLVLAGAGLLFAGGAQEEADPDEPVTIDYAFWGNPEAIGVERDIIDAFHDYQDEVRVSPVVSGYGDYHAMLLTQLAGGTGPDVMRVDSYYFADFLDLNALRAIDDLVERDNLDLSEYYAAGLEENMYEGTLYGLPWATAPLYMFINLDVFEERGVEVPDYDWNLEDFERIARQLSEGDGYGFGIQLGTVSTVLPFIWANGGDMFDESRDNFTMNEPEAVEALDWLAGLYADGVIPEDAITADADALTRWFVNGEIGMRMGSAAEILSTQAVEGARFEVMNMPTGDGIDNTTVYKSNIIGINSRSDKVDAAWEFIKFLRGPDGLGEELYMQARRMAPTFDRQELWGIYADPDLYPRRVEEASKLIADRYGRLLPLRVGWLEVESLVIPELQGILSGDVSAQEAMDGIAADAQAVLDR